MTEFIVPQAGRYHVGTGQEPHLVGDCTDACRLRNVEFVAEPGSYVAVEFDTYSTAPTRSVMDVIVSAGQSCAETTEALETSLRALRKPDA